MSKVFRTEGVDFRYLLLFYLLTARRFHKKLLPEVMTAITDKGSCRLTVAQLYGIMSFDRIPCGAFQVAARDRYRCTH